MNQHLFTLLQITITRLTDYIHILERYGFHDNGRHCIDHLHPYRHLFFFIPAQYHSALCMALAF